MTESFQVSGFDAIEKFFEGTKSNSNGDDVVAGGGGGGGGGGSSSSKNDNTSRGRRGRSGVGHSVPSSSSDKANEALRQTLLKVGRKKRLRDGNYDDDDDEACDDDDRENNGAKHGLHADDDLDDELGRTAIAAEKVEKPPGTKMTLQSNNKKLGKKERMKLKKLQKEGEGSTSADGYSAKPCINNESTDDANTAISQDTLQQHCEVQDQNPRQQQKRKRRKVRSRQKNIYKDHRSNEEKPSHLIPGSKNYQGRPITEATRKRLGIPTKSTTSTTNKGKNSFHHRSSMTPADDGDLFVIDREPSSTIDDGVAEDDVGLKLAVDDLDSSDDDDNGSDDEGERVSRNKVYNMVKSSVATNVVSTSEKMNSKKKTKTKKKRRYKNLL